ncbi:unnamed protein product [Effrenium voratum]|nr:unnamed protein product [Effrenium voratum]
MWLIALVACFLLFSTRSFLSAAERAIYDAWDARSTREIFLNFATSPASDAGLASTAAARAAEAAILDAVDVSDTDIAQLRRLEQRLTDGTYNPAWLAARRWRLTAGRFVDVRRVGRHKELAKGWLDQWWYRGQERLNHKINRSIAFEDRMLERYRQTHAGVQSVGLLVSKQFPWLGASPDGLVMSGDQPQYLIEIKSMRASLGKKSPAWHQMQGAMAIASDAFGVPVELCKLIDPVENYNIRFDKPWWDRYLVRLRHFYFGTYLPMAAKRILRRLSQ